MADDLPWRDRIQNLTTDATFNKPASAAAIIETETVLGVQFPPELTSLLNESDGMTGEYGLGLLWPVETIRKSNLEFRTKPVFRELYMPFDCLLFFGDAGNGDQFAYVILDGEVRRNDIFVWNHEDDSRTWVAPRLDTFYNWWLSGILKI